MICQIKFSCYLYQAVSMFICNVIFDVFIRWSVKTDSHLELVLSGHPKNYTFMDFKVGGTFENQKCLFVPWCNSLQYILRFSSIFWVIWMMVTKSQPFWKRKDVNSFTMDVICFLVTLGYTIPLHYQNTTLNKRDYKMFKHHGNNQCVYLWLYCNCQHIYAAHFPNTTSLEYQRPQGV